MVAVLAFIDAKPFLIIFFSLTFSSLTCLDIMGISSVNMLDHL